MNCPLYCIGCIIDTGDPDRVREIEMKWRAAMPNVVTPSEHVRRAAAYLSINTVTESRLVWIARLALTAPMAPGTDIIFSLLIYSLPRW